MPKHVLMSEIEIITDGGRRRRSSRFFRAAIHARRSICLG